MILPLASRVLRNNRRFLHARVDLSRAIKRPSVAGGSVRRIVRAHVSGKQLLPHVNAGPDRRRNVQREKFHPLPASSAVIDSFAPDFTHVTARTHVITIVSFEGALFWLDDCDEGLGMR